MNQSHKNNQPTDDAMTLNKDRLYGIDVAIESLFGAHDAWPLHVQLHIANRLTEVLDNHFDGEELEPAKASFILSRLRRIHESIGETLRPNSLAADEAGSQDADGPPYMRSTEELISMGGFGLLTEANGA